MKPKIILKIIIKITIKRRNTKRRNIKNELLMYIQ